MSLPRSYLITPRPEDEADFLGTLERSLQAGVRLMQFRAKGIAEADYPRLAERVVKLAHEYDCRVLLNGEPSLVEKTGADGLHLDSKALNSCTQRPLAEPYLIAVSGHTLAALQQGEAINASFAVLSPVNYTSAHPDIEPLGWDGFGAIARALSMPVYALGGVSAEDEENAIQAGGQGVAGNKGYWKN